MMSHGQGAVVREFDAVSSLGQRYQAKGDVGAELDEVLLHWPSGKKIAVINSAQNHNIDASLDVLQHASNTHMYWIPDNMMPNAISGIAPIS